MSPLFRQAPMFSPPKRATDWRARSRMATSCTASTGRSMISKTSFPTSLRQVSPAFRPLRCSPITHPAHGTGCISRPIPPSATSWAIITRSRACVPRLTSTASRSSSTSSRTTSPAGTTADGATASPQAGETALTSTTRALAITGTTAMTSPTRTSVCPT